VLAARVPGSILAAKTDRLQLSIQTGARLRPCDLNPASPDSRLLGICVRQIDLSTRESNLNARRVWALFRS
jgi:hypothetical protein